MNEKIIPFMLDNFSWDILTTYIKHGYGDVKLYNTSFFSCNLTDETACLTLEEFAKNAVGYDNNLLWKDEEK